MALSNAGREDTALVVPREETPLIFPSQLAFNGLAVWLLAACETARGLLVTSAINGDDLAEPVTDLFGDGIAIVVRLV